MAVPSMGDSITEGTIAAVEKGVGDSVSVDEIVAIIDTDKVSVEVRADAAGVIEEIFVEEGDVVVPWLRCLCTTAGYRQYVLVV